MTTDERERTDLLEALHAHRGFLRQTAQGLSDEDARRQTTVSELSVGGIIKHVTQVEQRWVEFIRKGPEAMAFSPDSMAERTAGFQMLPTETLADLLAEYESVANRTDDLVRTITSLDADQPLPDAPWFPKGRRSARRVIVHIIAETAQHAGHADIIREAVDGAKTMG